MEIGFDPHEYNVTVRKIVYEGEILLEARVKELPDVCECGETMTEAYDLAVDAIETAARMYAEAGRTFPPPSVPQDDFSGRVTLRLPKTLHRTLALGADEEGASLNQHLVNILAHHAGVQMALNTRNAETEESYIPRSQP
ncbi:MAG: toxin-antitoxin system HicB family antitoxin [Gammaproteobacteria bacterium]|nr:toxin-antitoxin system HicB family antitoxin [Gammaproteobacteria bacterium]